jgi:hypothetical protein
LNSSTGAITGTPSSTVSPAFTIQAVDAAGATVTKDFTITIAPALIISTTTLPGATKDTAYTHAVASTGGTGTTSWSISSGTLPPGLNLNASSGAISGTPTAAGTVSFTIRVTDSVGASTTRLLSITTGDVLKITTTALPGGTAAADYSKTLAASGGTAPLAWSVTTGTLPSGLSLDGSTGTISGTPTTGTSTFTVQVVDSAGAKATQDLTLTIAVSLTITTTALPNASTGIAYTADVVEAGGTAPFTWSITSGTLPTGLSLNRNTGRLAVHRLKW